MSFQLHHQLAKDTYHLGDFTLSTLLLSKDANYPWFILVPKRNDISEPFQLEDADYSLLQQESLQLSHALYSGFKADKLNIAALGNMVPQLHIHHIVRYKNDSAWPNPVWGFQPAQAYKKDALDYRITTIMTLLKDTNFFPNTAINNHTEANKS